MSREGNILIAGLGSPHGDDRAGWLVAEQLAASDGETVDVIIRKAVVPLDLIDWLNDIERLFVCDACDAVDQNEPVRKFIWSADQLIAPDSRGCRPALSFAGRNCSGSHDFGLLEVLQLAGTTGQLPREVVVWAVPGFAFQPGDMMTAETCLAAAETTEQIREALNSRRPLRA